MAKNKYQLVILDIGHGNCAVFTDSKGVVIIDAGPRSGLFEYLSEQQITKIDLVLISHADDDHIAGLIALLASNQVQIDCVRLNSDGKKNSKVWDELAYELSLQSHTKKLDFQPALTINDTGRFDRNEIKIEIVAPTSYLATKSVGSTDRKGRRIDTNSISAVIRLSQNGTPIALFPGDLDEVGLDNLIEHQGNVSAPILVFPHHGGKAGQNTNMVEFTRKACEVFEPETVIFSIGRGKHKTPQPEVVKTIRQCIPNVKIICTQLSEHCATSLPKINPTHLVNVFSGGCEKHKCCAGTIIIDLDSNVLFPLYSTHQSFIRENAPTALCQTE